MKLEKIKLAGFKSFVDSTTVHLPSNLIGIVGPNGCGKSNIIDAVRWVLGESSAKQLRGESILDVIFNGSTDRKPVNQAFIELYFDNSDGAVTGEYAAYNQIVVKREINRDGQSIYSLNGSRCRRKDITDVFLGTGMGPRSYSIIEQGMISQVVEAKPDELRAHLEEVAGISKYKERRRETENRIRHTNDNLSRINDIREELDKQLNHLRRQARAAERYGVLKEEERLLKAQLLALKWQALEEEFQNFNVMLNKQEVLLESYNSTLQRTNTDLDNLFNNKTEYGDRFNDVQSRYYRVGSEIARLEQAISHQKERKLQLSHDLEQLESTFQEANQSIDRDRARMVELREQLAQSQPQKEEAEANLNHAQMALAEIEQKMQDWQQEWDEFNREAAESAQIAQVEQTRIQHLESQQLQASQRLEKIDQEKQYLNVSQLKIALKQLTESLEDNQIQEEQLRQDLDYINEEIAQNREKVKGLESDIRALSQALQAKQGHYVSLEALQQAALGKKDGSVVNWLERHELHAKPRLAQNLKVDDGWERAVETVLGKNLEAVCVDGVDSVATFLQSLDEGSLILFDTQVSHASAAARHGATLLSSKVQSSLGLSGLLSGVYVADTLSDALQMRDSLDDQESVVTSDGIWLGRNWLRVSKDSHGKAGVIQRERELDQLKQEIDEDKTALLALEQSLDVQREAGVDLDRRREESQLSYSKIKEACSEAQAKIRVQSTQIEETERRYQHLLKESAEQEQQLNQSQESLLKSRQLWQSSMSDMEQHSEIRDRLLQKRDAYRQNLLQTKERVQQDKDVMHQIDLMVQSNEAQLNSLTQAIARTEEQLKRYSERQEQLTQLLEENDEPLDALQTELAEHLEERAVVEKEMLSTKQTMDNLEHDIQQLVQKRRQAEDDVQRARSELEEKRLYGREIKVKQAGMEEQLEPSAFELETLLTELPEEAEVLAWEELIEKMASRISRLGPINLAAIDEFNQQSERKEYLDAQHADLEESLQTLQNAIRKIDRETRARFKETFDTVNRHFQELFPKVFGGGQAYLELTGEDLLETGVTMMARPPGKRITNIHLLSGGEKALTAMALVFSLFQINPSPFCMLDEVDAPLDDTNVGRFCDLVKEMSEKVQFIFVSHNKGAIEMARHLMGVTMNEPGVSRIVAVDIDAAIAMVEA